jgi:pterin-4a-carbinolamine dehydratase
MPKPKRTRRAAATGGPSNDLTVREDLKAERIQEMTPGKRPPLAGIKPQPAAGPLSPENVRALLEKLPGWQPTRRNRALVRTFTFPGRRATLSFAAFVGELAATGGYNAWIDLRNEVAVVTVFSPRAGGVTLADIQFASMLGEVRT